MNRRALLARSAACAVAAAVAGCAAVDLAPSGPPAPAPTFKPGDRWVYRGREGFRLPVVWEETREVTAVTPDIRVRVSYAGGVTGDRTEVLAAPGLVLVGSVMDIETRRFMQEPLRRFAFPLVPGEAWNQWVFNANDTAHRSGQINHYVRVGGWEKVSTPAGTFDAIRLRVLMRLDDEEFWRGPTMCNYLVWYAPAVGAPVREEKEAEYYEKGDRRDGVSAVRSQHTLIELVAYSRGA